MTSPSELVALSTTVVLSIFALAFAFGAITQRTNFCTMGSVADIVSFGDWTRMRQWLLAIAVALLGTNLSGRNRGHRHGRQLLHVATLHAARVCNRRPAVRIWHGA